MFLCALMCPFWSHSHIPASAIKGYGLAFSPLTADSLCTQPQLGSEQWRCLPSRFYSPNHVLFLHSQYIILWKEAFSIGYDIDCWPSRNGQMSSTAEAKKSERRSAEAEKDFDGFVQPITSMAIVQIQCVSRKIYCRLSPLHLWILKKVQLHSLFSFPLAFSPLYLLL